MPTKLRVTSSLLSSQVKEKKKKSVLFENFLSSESKFFAFSFVCFLFFCLVWYYNFSLLHCLLSCSSSSSSNTPETMLLSILILVLLLLLGFMSTNLPTKKFLVWFRSLKNPLSSYAVAETAKSPSAGGGEEQRRSYNMGNKDELKRVFATFDKNSDGFITKQELRDSLKNIGIVMADKDIDDMVKNVDTNGDGLIDLDEFCDSFASLFIKEETGPDRDQGGGSSDNTTAGSITVDGDLKEAFDIFDGDKDGLITVEELGFVLSSLGFREGNRLEDCKEMIRKVDVDGDGMVSFEEFKIMMKAGHRLVPVS